MRKHGESRFWYTFRKLMLARFPDGVCQFSVLSISKVDTNQRRGRGIDRNRRLYNQYDARARARLGELCQTLQDLLPVLGEPVYFRWHESSCDSCELLAYAVGH